MYRLTEEKITDGENSAVFQYQYDNTGNRIYSIEDGVHTQYAYDPNDRLLKQGDAEYKYDNNGNLAEIAYEDGITRYTWDAAGNLIQAEIVENGNASVIRHAYDAAGSRLETSADGQTVRYITDTEGSLSQVVAELDADNLLLASYLYGDDLIARNRNGQTGYYHYDGQGSTRLLTDAGADITDTYAYDAFGEMLGQTGASDNNYLYAGERIDPNTGDYYLRARYYRPGSGRFLSMDSFGGDPEDPATLHKYVYGNADPVNFSDPSGYFGLMDAGMANDIRVTLMKAQMDYGLNLLEVVLHKVVMK